MKSEQERIKKLLRDELDKDTEKIIEEVEADESLKNLALPEDMDAGLQAKIKQYEANQAVYENLSDGDKEALRLGREQQILRAKDGSDDDDGNGGGSGNGAGSGTEENSDERKVVKFSKRRRMAFGLVAIVAVLVMGFGMTSIGGKPFLTEMVQRLIGGRRSTYIEPKDEKIFIDEKSSEDTAYQSIKDEFGFDAVELKELPNGTSFLEYLIDTQMKEAYLLYDYQGNVIEYRVLANYQSKSFGYDVEDQILNRYTITVRSIDIEVTHYKIKESNQEQYTAQFKYNNINYVLRASLDEKNFNNILKNLNFF